MEDRLNKIEEELRTIRERNSRVESDKAWETSISRMFVLALITYLVATVLLYLISVENFLLGALIPTAGFILSVQSLPAIKRWWINSRVSK